MTHHLLRKAGANDAGVDVSTLNRLYDSVHWQTNKVHFFQIGFRINALPKHFPGSDQIAAKCLGRDSRYSFPGKIG